MEICCFHIDVVNRWNKYIPVVRWELAPKYNFPGPRIHKYKDIYKNPGKVKMEIKWNLYFLVIKEKMQIIFIAANKPTANIKMPCITLFDSQIFQKTKSYTYWGLHETEKTKTLMANNNLSFSGIVACK